MIKKNTATYYSSNFEIALIFFAFPYKIVSYLDDNGNGKFDCFCVILTLGPYVFIIGINYTLSRNYMTSFFSLFALCI